MHSGFEQFKAFVQDAIDNKAFLTKGMLIMPVLAVGGEKSFGDGNRHTFRSHECAAGHTPPLAAAERYPPPPAGHRQASRKLMPRDQHESRHPRMTAGIDLR
jgi:hypothetical protein